MFIRAVVEEHPEFDQKAVGMEVEKRFGVSFSPTTISRLMKNNGIHIRGRLAA